MADYAERTYRSEDGLRLYYRDYAGPSRAGLTVLCLPGLTRNSRDFEDVAAWLAARARVLCADLRGRGRSEYAHDPMTYVPAVYVRDVARLLDDAGADRAVFLGTSLGGMVTMIAANVMGERVAGAILNDIGPQVDPAGLARVRGYVGRADAARRWEEAAAQVKAVHAAAYPDWTERDWMTMARRLYAERPDGTIRPDYDPAISVPFRHAPTGDADLWSMFAGMRGIPVLVLRGERSDILAPQTLARMRDVHPELEHAIVPRVGHTPWLREPEAITAIERFLARLAERGGAAAAR